MQKIPILEYYQLLDNKIEQIRALEEKRLKQKTR